MPDILQYSDRASKKRRINEEGNDPDCEVIAIKQNRVKRFKFDSVPNFITNIAKSFSDWVKKASQKQSEFFGLNLESNSAADAIAHGGQYLDEASKDKFMTKLDHNIGNGGFKLSDTGSSGPSLPAIVVPKRLPPQNSVYVNGDSLSYKTSSSFYNLPTDNNFSSMKPVYQSSNKVSQESQGNPGSRHSKHGKERKFNHSGTVNRTHDVHSYHNALMSDNSNLLDVSNGCLQKAYTDQSIQSRASGPSVYNRTFTDTYQLTASKKQTRKTTIGRCFDLEEKERYRRLLQHVSMNNVQTSTGLSVASSSQPFGRLSTPAPFTSILGDSLRRYLFQPAANQSSTLLETPVSTPSHSPGKSKTSRSGPTDTKREIIPSSTPISNKTKHPAEANDEVIESQSSPTPSAATLRCDNLVRQMEDLRERTATRLAEKRRLAKAEELMLSEWEKKRQDEDEHLRRMVKLRLNIAPKVILDDLPVQEPEIDEFPALSDEAEALVDEAFSSGSANEVLSAAFKLKITRKDLATLKGMNWLNDEVINFYFNLIQDRSEKPELPTVYVFNTFFLDTLSKFGHSRLRRWTKNVDIFSKDLILIPVHLGMHWCLACIDFRDHTIRYYDSMGGSDRGYLGALKRYLEAESMDKKKQPYDTSNWKLYCVHDIPQQMNGSDCGVFSCKYAEYLSRNVPFTFSQENMPYFRRRMVYEILSKSLM